MKLEDFELKNVYGGLSKGFCYAVLLGIGSFLAFITGVVDGYLNPQKCN